MVAIVRLISRRSTTRNSRLCLAPPRLLNGPYHRRAENSLAWRPACPNATAPHLRPAAPIATARSRSISNRHGVGHPVHRTYRRPLAQSCCAAPFPAPARIRYDTARRRRRLRGTRPSPSRRRGMAWRTRRGCVWWRENCRHAAGERHVVGHLYVEASLRNVSRYGTAPPRQSPRLHQRDVDGKAAVTRCPGLRGTNRDRSGARKTNQDSALLSR